MRNVNIEIFHIAQTRVNPTAVSRWLEHLNTSEEYRDEMDRLMDEGLISEPSMLIGLAAKRCYNSFEPGLNPNVTKVRRDWTEYLDNVIKSRHGSVMEHATHSFAIEGVSRVFTGEMNRHRAGVAVSEASMRYIRYNDIPSWLPDSIKLFPSEMVELENDETGANTLSMKKWKTQQVFKRHYGQTEVNYKEIQDIWKEELAPESKFHGKKAITSMARRIIPMGVATGGVWTLNMRALRHIMALRASEAAEEEILHVWSRAGKLMVEQEPILLGDFTQSPEGYWIPKYDKV